MNTLNSPSKNTAAFFLQAAIAFGVSLLGALGGILFLPLRDQEEAATIRVRLDEVRMEKLLAEHNPFTTST